MLFKFNRFYQAPEGTDFDHHSQTLVWQVKQLGPDVQCTHYGTSWADGRHVLEVSFQDPSSIPAIEEILTGYSLADPKQQDLPRPY